MKYEKLRSYGNKLNYLWIRTKIRRKGGALNGGVTTGDKGGEADHFRRGGSGETGRRGPGGILTNY